MSEQSETIAIEIKDVQEEENDNETKINSAKNYCAAWSMICSIVICSGIGIACIIIALEQNQPDETNIIHLEGEIVYVLYLGVAILFCVCMCLCGTIFAFCCSDLCIFCVH